MFPSGASDALPGSEETCSVEAVGDPQERAALKHALARTGLTLVQERLE